MMNAQAKLERAEALCREVRGELEKKDVPPTYCGLTAKQWERVAEMRALVEVRDDDGEDWRGPVVLRKVQLNTLYPFNCPVTLWKQARLALIPGHIVPWFGGESPVRADTPLSVLLENKYGQREWIIREVCDLLDGCWKHESGFRHVIAFIFYSPEDLR